MADNKSNLQALDGLIRQAEFGRRLRSLTWRTIGAGSALTVIAGSVDQLIRGWH